MSGLEIAALVIAGISASTGAISALKDARALSRAEQPHKRVTTTVDRYGSITKTEHSSSIACFGTAEVHVRPNGGMSAYSTGAGSSALGVYSKTYSYN